MLDIIFVDWLRIVQILCKMERNTYFVGADIVVWGNHAATAVIHPFTHHVLSKKTFLSLKDLPDSCRGVVTAKRVGVLLGIHVAIHVSLQLDEEGQRPRQQGLWSTRCK